MVSDKRDMITNMLKFVPPSSDKTIAEAFVKEPSNLQGKDEDIVQNIDGLGIQDANLKTSLLYFCTDGMVVW